MAILSRTALIYAPQDNPCGEIVLVNYNDILVEPIDRAGATTIQRDAVLARAWLAQRAQGNASLSLSCACATVHATQADAEAYGYMRQLELLTHPIGSLLEMTAYRDDMPTLIVRWTATVDQCDPQPLSSDIWFGPVSDGGRVKAAWQSTAYSLTLTNPQVL